MTTEWGNSCLSRKIEAGWRNRDLMMKHVGSVRSIINRESFLFVLPRFRAPTFTNLLWSMGSDTEPAHPWPNKRDMNQHALTLLLYVAIKNYFDGIIPLPCRYITSAGCPLVETWLMWPLRVTRPCLALLYRILANQESCWSSVQISKLKFGSNKAEVLSRFWNLNFVKILKLKFGQHFEIGFCWNSYSRKSAR